MDNQKLKVSVIICAYTMERLKDIHEAVDSVLAQTLKPDEIIIAVDHNRELFERLKAELPRVIKVVLNEGAQGLSETRNVGIRASTGGIIAFIDDDAVAKGDWLEHLVKRFHDPKVAVVGGRAIPIWARNKRPLYFPEELDWIVGCTYKGLPINGDDVRNVIGCNMCFRKDIFEQGYSWNIQFGRKGETGVGEEAELCLTIRQEKPDNIICYKPESIIYHKVPLQRSTASYIARRSYDEGLNKARLRRLSSALSGNSLSTENAYLRYLLLESIPKRLRFFHTKGSILQVGTIILSIAAVGAGYLAGKVKG